MNYARIFVLASVLTALAACQPKGGATTADGADVEGTGLPGMRRRVAALDGTFTVTSPAGGPTVIETELPCAW